MGEPHTATQPPHWDKPATADRWHLICRLLAAPSRESRRLGKLLTGWPATVRRHLLVDDCARRLWVRGSSPEAVARVPWRPEVS
jgi:hypothetical protein